VSVPGIFLLVVVIVVVVVLALVLTGNVSWLGWRGSDPERQGAPGTSEPEELASDERPRHTVVDLDQNREDEPRGKPLNRAP
jgi:hypothetical protein